MRLDADQAQWIAEAVREHFGPHAQVRLFGSRLDDAGRGGDIDLFVDAFEGSAAEALQRRLSLLVALKERLGDQRIDVVVARTQGPHLPIHDVAREQGAVL